MCTSPYNRSGGEMSFDCSGCNLPCETDEPREEPTAEPSAFPSTKIPTRFPTLRPSPAPPTTACKKKNSVGLDCDAMHTSNPELYTCAFLESGQGGWPFDCTGCDLKCTKTPTRAPTTQLEGVRVTLTLGGDTLSAGDVKEDKLGGAIATILGIPVEAVTIASIDDKADGSFRRRRLGDVQCSFTVDLTQRAPPKPENIEEGVVIVVEAFNDVPVVTSALRTAGLTQVTKALVKVDYTPDASAPPRNIDPNADCANMDVNPRCAILGFPVNRAACCPKKARQAFAERYFRSNALQLHSYGLHPHFC